CVLPQRSMSLIMIFLSSLESLRNGKNILLTHGIMKTLHYMVASIFAMTENLLRSCMNLTAILRQAFLKQASFNGIGCKNSINRKTNSTPFMKNLLPIGLFCAHT